MFRNNKALVQWLNEELSVFKDTFIEDIIEHIKFVKEQYKDVYCYSILPGNSYEINSITTAFNCLSNLKNNDVYDRYSVDEWNYYEDISKFDKTNAELQKLNETFKQLNKKNNKSSFLNRYESKLISNIFNACIEALIEVKAQGYFINNGESMFVCVWVSDDDTPFVIESVKKLNSNKAVSEFLSEFN